VRKEELQINVKFNAYTYFDYNMQFSRIVDSTNRINPFEKERIHYFLTSIKFGEVEFPKYETWYYATRDNGKTVIKENVHLFYAFRFLPDSKVTIEERKYANVLDILSFVGGLYLLLVKSFGFMNSYIGQRTVQGKFIRSLYFERDFSSSGVKHESTLLKSLSNLKPIQIGFDTYVGELKSYLRMALCFCNRNPARMSNKIMTL
jgi:hypothetical protein